MEVKGGVERQELGEDEGVMDGVGFDELGVDLGEVFGARGFLEEGDEVNGGGAEVCLGWGFCGCWLC